MNGARALLFALLAQITVAASVTPAAAQEAVRRESVAAPQAELPNARATGADRIANRSGEDVATGGPVDIITPHITDSRTIDYPCWNHGTLLCETELPTWAPIHVAGYAIDMSPTKHVVMLLFAGFLCCLVLITAARAHARHSHAIGRPKGFAAGIESMVLYIRQEVAIRNLGPHGEKYAPFILTLFFFIMFANLLGLIPYGSTATGNISVTATLAIISFVVIEISGIRAQGLGYLNTLFFWQKDLALPLRVIMFLIISPIEMVGKIARPFALTIRLFANMTAGHIVVLAFIGLIFFFKSLISGAPFLLAIAIMMLELAVAFIQAFVFTLLTAVFIGQVREAHH